MSITTDYRVHPDSTVDKPLDESVIPDTGICGTFRQAIYQCVLCQGWSMDHRMFIAITVSNGTGHQCKDFTRCQRRSDRAS